MKYLTYIFIAGLLLVVGCGVSTADIDATVEARIASIPTPTPQIVIQIKEYSGCKGLEDLIPNLAIGDVITIHEIVALGRNDACNDLIEKLNKPKNLKDSYGTGTIKAEVETDFNKIMSSLEEQIEASGLVEIPLFTPAPEPTATPVPTSIPLPTPTPQPVLIAWKTIVEERNANTIVADMKYLEQPLTVKGEISAIEDWESQRCRVIRICNEWIFEMIEEGSYKKGVLDGFGTIPVVTLSATVNGKTYYLNCGVDSIDEVVNLSVGDTVVVFGDAGKAWESRSLFLHPCEVAD